MFSTCEPLPLPSTHKPKKQSKTNEKIELRNYISNSIKLLNYIAMSPHVHSPVSLTHLRSDSHSDLRCTVKYKLYIDTCVFYCVSPVKWTHQHLASVCPRPEKPSALQFTAKGWLKPRSISHRTLDGPRSSHHIRRRNWYPSAAAAISSEENNVSAPRVWLRRCWAGLQESRPVSLPSLLLKVRWFRGLGES